MSRVLNFLYPGEGPRLAAEVERAIDDNTATDVFVVNGVHFTLEILWVRGHRRYYLSAPTSYVDRYNYLHFRDDNFVATFRKEVFVKAIHDESLIIA